MVCYRFILSVSYFFLIHAKKRKEALDSNPSPLWGESYHGFFFTPTGNNLGIPSLHKHGNPLPLRGISYHGHPEACFACMQVQKKKALDQALRA